MKNYLSAFGRVGFGVAMSIGLLSSAALIAVPTAAFAAAPMNVYTELPRTDAVNVSPNGKRVALIAPYNDTKAVFVYDLANPDDVKVLPPPEGSLLNGIRWGSDKHVVMFTQFRRVDSKGRSGRFGREYSRNISTNVETGKQVILLERKIYEKRSGGKSTGGGKVGSSQGGNFTHSLPNDQENILMSWGEYSGKVVRRHYKVNLDTGRESLVRSMPIATSRTIMSADGDALLARSEYDRRAKEWNLYVGDDQMAKPILTKSVPKDENPVWGLITILPTGQLLINEGETDDLTLYTVDPATGAQTRYNLNVDVNLPDKYDYGPLFDNITRELIGVSWTDDHTQVA